MPWYKAWVRYGSKQEHYEEYLFYDKEQLSKDEMRYISDEWAREEHFSEEPNLMGGIQADVTLTDVQKIKELNYWRDRADHAADMIDLLINGEE